MLDFNMKMKIMKKREDAIIPVRATDGAAGIDLCACIDEDIVLKPGESIVIPMGFAIELPSKDMAAFIFARSGLSTKFGVALCNAVGVVDSDYRGEICVPLRNFGTNEYTIKKNERVAQMVIMPVYCLPIVQAEFLNDTIRGENGFGSTGR